MFCKGFRLVVKNHTIDKQGPEGTHGSAAAGLSDQSAVELETYRTHADAGGEALGLR